MRIYTSRPFQAFNVGKVSQTMWILYFVGQTIKHISLKKTIIIDLISKRKRWMMGTRVMCQKPGKECYTVHRETLSYKKIIFVCDYKRYQIWIEKYFNFFSTNSYHNLSQLVNKFLWIKIFLSVDVDDVICAGRRDDNSQAGGRRRGVLRLLVDVVRRRRVSAVSPDLTAQGL